MAYKNFEADITLQHGIIIEDWPLDRFGPPGSFSSIPTLTTLVTAWTSGMTRFRSLSDEEWTAWRNAWVNGENPSGVLRTSGILPDAPHAFTQTDGAEDGTATVQDAELHDTHSEPHATDVDPSAPSATNAETSTETSATASGADTGASAMGAEPAVPTAATASDPFVNMFSDGFSGRAPSGKKTRKKRSDAGVRRGPRNKGKGKTGSAVTTPAHASSPSASASAPAASSSASTSA